MTTSSSGDPETDGVGPGVWVVGLDGTGLRRIGTGSGAFSWSPTGDRLAIAVSDWIWKMPLSAAAEPTTIAVGAPWARCIDWSARGEIAWVTSTGELRMADDTESVGRVVGRVDDDPGPSCQWSPDGSLFAVRSSAFAIYRADGSVLARYTPSGHDYYYGAYYPANAAPAWSPDGSAVAIAMVDADTREYQVFVVNPSQPWPDAPVFQKPDTEGPIEHIRWQPDGAALLIQDGRDTQSKLYLVSVRDRTSTMLEGGCCQRLEPLADGRFVAFASRRKLLTVVEANRQTSKILARGKAPDPNGPITSECSGTYLLDEQPSHSEQLVAFLASASYGPRCDSPIW
jgi:Tol biopolymer transport system component